jgi:hypothetical protein
MRSPSTVRLNSNSTPASAGDKIRRSHPPGSTSTSCPPRRSSTGSRADSSPVNRAIDVPSAVAIRSNTGQT